MTYEQDREDLAHHEAEIEAALDAFVPRWIASVWPFTRPRYVGRDLSWDEWMSLPDL